MVDFKFAFNFHPKGVLPSTLDRVSNSCLFVNINLRRMNPLQLRCFNVIALDRDNELIVAFSHSGAVHSNLHTRYRLTCEHLVGDWS